MKRAATLVLFALLLLALVGLAVGWRNPTVEAPLCAQCAATYGSSGQALPVRNVRQIANSANQDVGKLVRLRVSIGNDSGRLFVRDPNDTRLEIPAAFAASFGSCSGVRSELLLQMQTCTETDFRCNGQADVTVVAKIGSIPRWSDAGDNAAVTLVCLESVHRPSRIRDVFNRIQHALSSD